MDEQNRKKIFAAICRELGGLQEDCNAYRSDDWKDEKADPKSVADDFEYHVNEMIRILRLFNLDNLY